MATVDAAGSTTELSARVLLAATVLAGALLSVQARVNGALAGRLGSSVLTALVSFSVGTAALVGAVAATGRWRSARPRPGPPARWWWFCGGLGGATLVAASALAVPRIGVALLGVGIVAGQTVGSLVVDEVGLSPRGRQAMTTPRVAGALLAIMALAVGAAGEGGRLQIGLFALIAVAGAGVAAQQAANGQLQRLTGEPLLAALVSFTVGTVALAVGVLVLAAAGDLHVGEWPAEIGLYLGGLCGAAYITLSAAAVSRLGVLRLTLASVAGQLLGAVLLDLLRPTGGGLRAATVVATAMTLAAVAVSGRAALSARRAA
ncbi:MAG TPA: DMT family transporter [Mycobacteriales bacterium]|nr:DMT family transporter [Mycobacteriales bacterium]